MKGVTQKPIAPGASFLYEFDCPDAGTYWYHPHQRSSEQVGRGLAGALIVEEQAPPDVDRDITWVLGDWRLRQDAWGQGYAREAASAALDLAFTRFSATDVIALTVEGNSPSWGLMLRLGMRRRPDLDFANSEFDAASGVIIAYSISGKAWQGETE